MTGACRGDEITKLTVDNVKDYGEEIIVKIPDTKTIVSKMYLIGGAFAEVIRKYSKLRPTNAETNRYLLNYQNGKCTVQVVGKHKIARMPKDIATYLNLKDPKDYTGHSFRRTSTTILADSGAGIEEIKRHGNWKSNTVAEGNFLSFFIYWYLYLFIF